MLVERPEKTKTILAHRHLMYAFARGVGTALFLAFTSTPLVADEERTKDVLDTLPASYYRPLYAQK